MNTVDSHSLHFSSFYQSKILDPGCLPTVFCACQTPTQTMGSCTQILIRRGNQRVTWTVGWGPAVCLKLRLMYAGWTRTTMTLATRPLPISAPKVPSFIIALFQLLYIYLLISNIHDFSLYFFLSFFKQYC